MFEILEEEDFLDLPDEPDHKWLELERRARGRMNYELINGNQFPRQWLLTQYVNVVGELAEQFGVEGIPHYDQGVNDTQFSSFELKISRAKARIWASSKGSFPCNRISIPEDAKAAIIKLSAQIEEKINSLEESDRRRAKLHARLEEFRREVNQPRTNIGHALSSLAQVSTIVLMTTGAVAQGDEAYANILKLIGAAYSEVNGTELQLIEHEKENLISMTEPPRLLEDHRANDSSPDDE